MANRAIRDRVQRLLGAAPGKSQHGVALWSLLGAAKWNEARRTSEEFAAFIRRKSSGAASSLGTLFRCFIISDLLAYVVFCIIQHLPETPPRPIRRTERYDDSFITERKAFKWPGNNTLAVWFAPNVEVW